jgi:hypothetical protein
MLDIIFAKTDEEAVELYGKPYLEFPDILFSRIAKEDVLSHDEYFKRIVRDVDESELIADSVLKDIRSGKTHTLWTVSTGVKCLWLINHGIDYLMPTQWFGQNCYKEIQQLSLEKDIVLYEDSDMFFESEAEDLSFIIRDYRTGEVIDSSVENPLDYAQRKGYM